MTDPQADPKYLTLLGALDILLAEAPSSQGRYHPDASNSEAVGAARSLAFAHLYLKVKFGLESFKERDSLVTDGTADGGLDAFYIDSDSKVIHLIQAKFRTTADRFKYKEVSADELVRMELDRILNGETHNSNGTQFSGRILEFQKRLRQIGDLVTYKWRVILLCNLRRYTEEQIRKLIGNLPFEVFDHGRTYKELIFPLCAATYYDPSSITIQLDLTDKYNPALSQGVEVRGGQSQVTLIFVPTIEIARAMNKYKNAILRYNPRNYLSLSRNPVNREIRDSIVGVATNEFAILNNGITLVADEVKIAQHVGKHNAGQLLIVRPQIINGAQTACTLSEIYQHEYQRMPTVFDRKEVLLKIVTMQDVESQKPGLIQAVSNSTNRQTSIDEADRRANIPTFIDLQDWIFREFGYYFERKEGEFYYGLRSGVIPAKLIINRTDLVRSLHAFEGDAARARGGSETELFSEHALSSAFGSQESFRQGFFAYKCLIQLKAFQRAYNRGKYLVSRRLGNAFRYGKFGVICAIGVNNPSIPTDLAEVEAKSAKLVNGALRSWPSFERFALKGPANADYFRPGEKDFDNYYKGKTVNADLATHWRGKL